MTNFLALLGWSLDDKSELFTAEELIRHFSLERVAKSGAIFNIEKLDWMNGQYIRTLSAEALADELLNFWHAFPPEEFATLPDRPVLLKIVPLIQERMKTLRDAAPLIKFFFVEDIDYDTSELIQKKMDAADTLRALRTALGVIANIEPFDAPTLEAAIRPLAEDLDIKVGQILGTLRVATSGQKISPPLFESMELLGKARVLRDVEVAIEKLEANA